MPRVIDRPIADLPHIDEHEVGIRAGQDSVWDALATTLPKFVDNGLAHRFGALVGVEHREKWGEFPEVGATLTGFVVARSVPPAVLALMGEHRFSRYALVFRMEAATIGTRLRAETRAEFPGAQGRIYQGLVIDTRFHVLAVRRILSVVKGRAEAA
jgi:hypothetical protein